FLGVSVKRPKVPKSVLSGTEVMFRMPGISFLRAAGIKPPARSTRLPTALKGHAAGDLDALPVDPAIVFGEQGCDHRAHGVGLAGATERRHLRHAPVHLGVVADHAAAGPQKTGALVSEACVATSDDVGSCRFHSLSSHDRLGGATS